MRRVFVFFLFLLIVGGAAAAWVFTRPTPEYVLAGALKRFSQLPGANVRVSLFWDRLSPSGQGYVLDTWLTYGGLIDVRDLEHIMAKGGAGYGKTQNADDFQTANVALSATAFSVQPTKVDPSLLAWLTSAAGTSTEGAWFSFNRETLLKEKGFLSFIPLGRASDIRSAWEGVGFSEWASVRSSRERVLANGTRIFDAELALNPALIESGLVSLQSAWMAKDPSPAMLDWASRATQGIQGGEWRATYGTDAIGIHSISGKWPILNDDGRVGGHVTIQVDVLGAATVQDMVPEGAIDLTPAIRPPSAPGFAPANERIPVPVPATSSTETVVTSTEDASVQP